MEIILAVLLATAAAVAVALPVLRGRPRAALPAIRDEAALDAEVTRYRAALLAGTVCRRCRFANPAGSRFCADCGRRLPDAADA